MIKKIVGLCLVGLLSSNMVMSSFADSSNGTGTGNANTGSTEEYVGSYHAYHANQGMRVYIINSHGIPVSNTADFVRYFPEDLANGAAASNEAFTKMYNAFKQKTGYKNIPKAYIKYLGGAKTDNFYTSDLCIFDKNTKNFEELELELDSESNGVLCTTRDDGEYDRDNRDVYATRGKMYTYSLIEKCLIRDSQIRGYTPIVTGNNSAVKAELFIDGTKQMVDIAQWFMDPVRETINGLEVSGDELRNMLMAHLYIGDKERNTLQMLLTMDVPVMNGRGKQREGAEKIFQFFDPVLKAEYDTELTNGNAEAMVTVMKNNKLRVAIEPIHWAVGEVIFPTDKYGRIGNNQNAFYCTNTIVYGTTSKALYYIAEELSRDDSIREKYPEMPDIRTNGADFADWLGNNNISLSWDWNLGDSCYMLDRDEPDLSMVKYNPSLHDTTGNHIASWYTLGYGVMFFNLDDKPEGAVTSTYDRTQGGEAPSPENTNSDGTFPSLYPSEGKEYKEKGKDHSRNIVKFYCEKQTDGSLVYLENYIRNNTVSTINLENEGEYKVDGYFTSPEYKQPENENSSYDEWKALLPKGEFSGSKAEQIKMSADSTDTTLYMRLTKISADKPEIPDTKNIVLHENELAKVFSLSDLNNMVTITHEFTDHYKSGSGSHGDDEDSWNCDWETVLDNSSYLYELKNSTNYEDTTFIGSIGLFVPVETGTVVDTGEADIHGTITVGLTPNLKFTVYRDKAKDLVTLYKDKNSQSILDELGQIGITSQSYTAGNTRIEHEGNGAWTSTFSTSYKYSKKSDKLYFDSSCGSHGSSGSYNGTAIIGLDVLNKAFSQSDNILSKYELGRKNIGTETPITDSNAFTIFGKTFASQRLTKVNKGKDIEFFPYISMVYEGTKEAKVVSENISKLGNIQLIDTGVYFGNGKPTLQLSSEQWSNHARAIEGLKLNGVKQNKLNNSLLPGGATFDLKSANGSEAPEAWVGVKTYQVTVPDKNMEKLSKGEGVSSTSQGKIAADNMINQIRNNMEHYQIVQWIDNGIYTDEIPFRNSGSKVLISGSKAATSYNGKSLSTDRKYYLKVDGEGATRADIDILMEETEQHIWSIQNDNTGNVWIYKNGVEVARTEIGASKDISGLLVSEELKNLEEKTKLFSNYVKALDIKLGADRNSQPWYTEAFDGVEVVETSYAVQVGFGGSTPIRSSVLDTILTGKLDGKSDILNLTKETIKEKARTMQFRTSYRSTTVEAQSKENGWVADLNGSPVIIRGMDNVLRSKLFYTGNSTVMDLN